MNNNKSAILDEIMRIHDENRLLDIFKKEDDFEIRYSIVNLIEDDSILYEIFSNEKDSIIKNTALMKISTDILDYDDFNTLDDYEKIAYIETHDDESLFFKIAEMSENFYVRIAAIYKIQDMDFIWKMANSHKEYDTRVVLYKKLKNKPILEEISGENLTESRVSLVENLDNEKFIKDIFINDSDLEVKILALKKLNKPHFYINLFNPSNDDDLMQLMDDIKDESQLMDVASLFPSNQFIVEHAINNIATPSLLFELYRRGSYLVRKTAMEKLVFGNVFSHEKITDIINIEEIILSVCDKNLLAEIARNDSDSDVRRAAVKKINDEDVLADIARNDSDDDVRRAAVKKINDEDVLVDIARNTSNQCSRAEAIRRIGDDDIIADIARNSSDGYIRRIAIGCIHDEDVLADIARNDSNDISRETSQNDDLEDIAKNDSDYNVRFEAVGKITNEDVLVDIAKNEPYGFIRETAVKKINDNDVLADIARNDSDDDVRMAAVERIYDEDVLVDIVRNNSNGYIKEIALNKIRDSDTLQKLLLENLGYLPVDSFTAFKRNYHSMIYEEMGTGLYDYILDRIANESVFIDLLHKRLFGDFRVLVAKRLVSPDALRNLALNDLDYRVRLEAIRNPNLCDEETFAEIVQSDHNNDVRFEALIQIDNMNLLESISNDLDPVMRIYALKRLGNDMDFDKHYVAFDDIDLSSVTGIEDENVLHCIANDAPSAQLRRYAFDKIRNEDILADLACHNREFMNMALNKITDNALLLNIALYCADESVRRKAVKKIDDEELLLTAVQRNPCNDISSYIIDCIRDESLLEIIALNNSNPFNRKAAVNKIQSQDILIRLGEVECEEAVCTAIVRKCRDNGLLEYVGLSNPCKTVRRYVESVTDDDELLYRFALKEIEYDNRRELISRLTNEEYILNLLKRETVDEVFRVKFQRWADFKITDTSLLVDLAKNGVSDEAKKYALNHIKDQSVLKEFIHCSPFITNGSENESVWDDFQYHREGIGLCLSIIADSNFNDMKLIEDFLIQNDIYPSRELYDICNKVVDISSIYKITLNCKSQHVRRFLMNKCKYNPEHKHGYDDDNPNRDSREEEANIGLAALFG